MKKINPYWKKVDERQKGFWHRLLGHDWHEIQPFFADEEWICLRCGDYRFGKDKAKSFRLTI